MRKNEGVQLIIINLIIINFVSVHTERELISGKKKPEPKNILLKLNKGTENNQSSLFFIYLHFLKTILNTEIYTIYITVTCESSELCQRLWSSERCREKKSYFRSSGSRREYRQPEGSSLSTPDLRRKKKSVKKIIQNVKVKTCRIRHIYLPLHIY